MKSTAKAEKSNCDGSGTNRSKVRISFMEREKKETTSYIADLEATLAINKSIIQELCNPKQKESANYKMAFNKLNEENMLLQKRVREFKRQRDDASAKVLILEQVVEELRYKESEQLTEWKEANAELLEQLNLKEYHLQVFEKRCYDAEALVMKYLRNVPEVMEAIGGIRGPINEKIGISNVVIQNKQMQAKLAEMTSELTRLKKELGNSETKKMVDVLKNKINGLVAENEGQRQKLTSQSKMSQELYDLNEKLRTQLSNLNKQVSMLAHSQRIMRADTLYTQRSKDRTPPEVFYTQEVISHKKKESFGELSSISVNQAEEGAAQGEEDEGGDEHIDINLIGGD